MLIKKFAFCLLVVAFAQSFVTAQSKVTLEGIVQDSLQQPLIAATVVILNPADSIMTGFGLTDDQGRFKIGGIPTAPQVVQITYVGYGTFENRFDLTGTEKTYDAGIIRLAQNANQLAEVTVKEAFIPIAIKKDTIEYTADAFKVKPNATVEDLLKKLPGIEVEDDGSIKAQGEEVKTVTVDGKKFFGNDPKIATKNLPADAVNKVQVFDKKSEKAEFTGVDDGVRDKTINLELKEDKKQGIFGDVKLAGGSDLRGDNDFRTDNKLSINKFGGKSQISTLINFNNINQQGFSVNDYYNLTGTFRGSIPGVVSFGGFQPGIATSAAGGVNFNYDFAKDIKLTSSYFIGNVDNAITSNTTSENFRNETTFLSEDQVVSDTRNLSHNFNLEFDAKFDTLSKFNAEIDLRAGGGELTRTSLATNRLTTELEPRSVIDQITSSTNDNLDFGIDLTFNRRLGKPGRTINFDVGYGRGIDNDSTLLDQSGVFAGLPNTLLQDQIGEADDNSYNAEISYTEPIGKNYTFEAKARRTNTNTESIRQFFELDPQDRTLRTLNEALSNTFDNNVGYNFGGMSIQFANANIRINTGLEYKNALIEGTATGIDPVNNTFNFLLPSFSLDFLKKRINLNYNTSTQEPSIRQLSPILDNSDPTNIYIGNPNLRPEYSHRISLRYNFFDRFNFRGLFMNLSYRHVRNNIVTARQINEAFIRTSTPQNLGNQNQLNGNVSFNTPINALKIKTRIFANASYARALNFINNIENNVTTSSEGFGLVLENLNTDRISVQLSGRWNFSQNRYDVSELQNNDFLNQTYGLDVLFDFGKGWTWDNELKYNLFSNEAFADDNNFTLYNINISKLLLKDRLNLKLTIYDVLGQNQGINRSSTADSQSETLANILGTYAMLSASYKLSSFSPEKGRIFIYR